MKKKSGLASRFYLKRDPSPIDRRATMLQPLKCPSMRANKAVAKLQPRISIATERKRVSNRSNMYMIRLDNKENNIGMTLQTKKRKAITDLLVHDDLWRATMSE